MKTILTGSLGFAGVTATPLITDAVIEPASGIVQIIIQIAIGVATLIGLLKNKNKNK